MWQKSGAWFYKGIPNYDLPQRNAGARSSMRELRMRPERAAKLSMKVDESSSEDENTDSTTTRHNIPTRPLESNLLGRFDGLRIKTATSSSTPNINEENYLYRKISPLSMFSRQTNSSCDNSNGHPTSDWDAESLSFGSSSKPDNNIIPNSSTSLVRCGSMSSTYSMSETSSGNSSNLCSNAGPSQICREPPLGWLELSLLYTEADHALDCSILRARDLPAMDIASLADPYCKLNIITEYGTTKQKKWIQTKTVHKTRSPEFNETVRFFGVEPEELTTSTLYVVILDEDKFGSDFLGTAKIQLGPVTIE